jgi:hypothetical protein
MASAVAAAYHGTTAGGARTARGGDDPGYASNRKAMSKAWAIGLLADQAASTAAWVPGGGVLVLLAAELAAPMTDRAPGLTRTPPAQPSPPVAFPAGHD